jgi:hypothetical protein
MVPDVARSWRVCTPEIFEQLAVKQLAVKGGPRRSDQPGSKEPAKFVIRECCHDLTGFVRHVREFIGAGVEHRER